MVNLPCGTDAWRFLREFHTKARRSLRSKSSALSMPRVKIESTASSRGVEIILLSQVSISHLIMRFGLCHRKSYRPFRSVRSTAFHSPCLQSSCSQNVPEFSMISCDFWVKIAVGKSDMACVIESGLLLCPASPCPCR